MSENKVGRSDVHERFNDRTQKPVNVKSGAAKRALKKEKVSGKETRVTPNRHGNTSGDGDR